MQQFETIFPQLLGPLEILPLDITALTTMIMEEWWGQSLRHEMEDCSKDKDNDNNDYNKNNGSNDNRYESIDSSSDNNDDLNKNDSNKKE